MDIKTWTQYIINIYDKSETIDVYNRRANNESKNIKSVIKAITEQKFRLNNNQNKSDFIHILKAANSITLDSGNNYFEQFLQLQEVQKIITEKLTPSNIARVVQKARDNEQTGDLPNFPKTMAEADKDAANLYLASASMLKGRTPEQEILRFNEHIADILETGLFAIKTDATTLQDITQRQNLMLKLGRVLLRQQGMNPGNMKLEEGRVVFETDVPDKEPIFHGMKQEQGLSIAQQEELKKKQEAEQQYQQEQKKYAKDREKQTKDNNQYSLDTKKKREDEQRISQENSTKMSAKDAMLQQSRKYNTQKANSNAFKDSLKIKLNNENRTNIFRTQAQSHTHKRSKGMEMSM